jgi:putative colanic acid biosysnthesis UDP-glucose lipid carrier transferase
MESVPPLSHSEMPAFLEPVVHAPQGNLTIAKPSITVPFSFYFPLSRKGNAFYKRTFDLLLSSILILLIFPWFLPFAALFIKMESKGPVFFRQKRYKRGEEVFTCFKLRTMCVNEEADRVAARKDDIRITRLGRLLRRTHLDEFPQLFNVFLGDMSLIGPRPHMVSENLTFGPIINHYSIRHQVKPGMTGLAQVLGFTGHVTDIKVMEKRVEQDIFYIKKWSPLLDLKIIGLTVLKLLHIKQLH